METSLKLAIVGGVSDYLFQTKLPACRNDAAVMRSFLEETKSFADICFLYGATTGIAAKKAISEFVQKHRGSSVRELIFYFSGHGDRTVDDFFYAFSDYKSDKKESAGLRNSELDSLIRNLSPELTIKIVDACYSGSTYIKSEDPLGPTVEKSAKENKLKKLYFLHSSAADQTSLAGPQLSWFTQAIFQALVNESGAVRYRDLIAAVADEMEQKGGPRPTFVVQADNLEIFVHMEQALTDLVRSVLGLTGSSASPGTKVLDNLPDGSSEVTNHLPINAPVSLATVAESKVKDTYCTQIEAEQNLKLLLALADPESWPERIKDAFELQIRIYEAGEIPNRTAVARWISNSRDDSVFAKLLYDIETYTEEEYKEMPKKPTGPDPFSSFRKLHDFFGEEKEYKLETVEKKRRVLSGFDYTVDPIFSPHALHFVPKFASLEEYAACMVCVFSRKILTLLYSTEHLPYKAWNSTDSPRALQWKQLSASLKDQEKIKELVEVVVGEISDFIEVDARQRLS